MSTFSSVIRKPGQKITPKATPRRNVQRHTIRSESQNGIIPESRSSDIPAVLSGRIQSDLDLRRTQDSPAIDDEVEIDSTGGSDNRSRNYDALTTASTEKSHALVKEWDHLSSRPSEDSSISTNLRRSQRHIDQGAAVDGVPAGNLSNTENNSAVMRRENASISTQAFADVPTSVTNGMPIETLSTTERPSRKRKLTPVATPTVMISHMTIGNALLPEDSTSTTSNRRPKKSKDKVQPPEELLQNATTQAAAVSSLANSIDSRIRLLRPRRSQFAVDDLDILTDEAAQSALRKHQELSRRNLAANDGVSNHVNSASHKKKKRRGHGTPEKAEEHEINASQVHMGDLTKDNKLGKPSELGLRLREKWPEVLQRRKDQLASNRKQARERGKQGRKVDEQLENSDLQLGPITAEIPVPQMAIVNGVITVTTESREVAFGTGLEQAAVQDAENALEDDKIYRYVNQGTFGKHAGLSRGAKWDDETTTLFYQGLRMFGTDFMMIANMFPGMTRKQIKQKYVKEERSNLALIRESLGARQDVKLEEYAKLTNKAFEDPQKIQEELEAEERRLRAEDEKRRAQEGFILNDADGILPSTEEGNEETATMVEEGETTVSEANIQSQAEATAVTKDAVSNKKNNGNREMPLRQDTVRKVGGP